MKLLFRLKNPSTIRFRLVYIILVSVLPVWLIAGVLVIQNYKAKCDQVNKSLLETAHSLTMVVDRELSGVQATLLALATSPSFASGDFGSVHRQALQLLKSYPGADIIVADVTGQQAVNSARPYGFPLPKRNNPETVRRIFETGKPVISDLFYGALTKTPLISIDIPVICDGKIAYDLAMTFPSSRIASVLLQHQFPPGWYGSILDSRLVVVARSRYPEKYVGKMATPGLSRAITHAPEGVLENINFEGVQVFNSFHRSAISSWGVVIGVPKSSVMAEIYQWVKWVVATSVVLSLFGVAVALVIGRRIVRAEGMLKNMNKELESRVAERTHELAKNMEMLRVETAERIQAIEALREKEQLLIQQSRQAAMGEMIGNISHQWRQPLNTLGLQIQQLQVFHDLGLFNKEFLDKNVSESMQLVHHMSKTIDDFRNYFKPDKEKTGFSVHECIKTSLSLLEGSLKSPLIDVEVIAHDDPAIHGFPNEFAQVILNIMNNARDVFIERNVSEPKVNIKICNEGRCVVVTVADNAGGIPEDIITKVFDPYFTTKGPQQGTGIGLFMSKSIIEKNMGGRLNVRNTVNGAEFKIEVGSGSST